MKRDFLDLCALASSDLQKMLQQAKAWKAASQKGEAHDQPLKGKSIGLIFEKPSTRTRISFDLAVRQLGGESFFIDQQASHLHRGESLSDSGKLLSHWMAALVLRTHAHSRLEELAHAASVPVINGLSDSSHPCQLIADIMTVEEEKGELSDLKIAWLGDGCNVAKSWVEAAGHWGFRLDLATPKALQVDRQALAWAKAKGAEIHESQEPALALKEADVVVTDTWASMGDEGEKQERHQLLAPYQVNAEAMAQAKQGAIFLHCLPAYRGCEVTAEVIDGPQSRVWQEADNRLHSQKAILAWCLGAL